MKKSLLSISIALSIALLISSCKTTQFQTVQKAKSISGVEADTTEFGSLIGNSIGNSSGGLGLSGTGQGGGGAGNVSGIGGLGTISPGLGYGSNKKKEANKTSANDSKSSEQRSQARNDGAANQNSNQPSLSTSLAATSSSDQEKIKRLDAFKESPNKASAIEDVSVKREVKSAGFHPKEMPVGNYVAVESFVNEAQAIRYAARLVSLGFDPNVPRYVSADNRWYVCLEGPAKSSQVAERINYYRTMEIFESVWLLTIK